MVEPGGQCRRDIGPAELADANLEAQGERPPLILVREGVGQAVGGEEEQIPTVPLHRGGPPETRGIGGTERVGLAADFERIVGQGALDFATFPHQQDASIPDLSDQQDVAHGEGGKERRAVTDPHILLRLWIRRIAAAEMFRQDGLPPSTYQAAREVGLEPGL